MDKNKLYIGSEFKGIIDEATRLVSGVVGSSGIIDRHGESINPSGWELNNYLKNPVVLYGHDYRSLPIGKTIKVYVENGQLKFDIQFADTAFASQVFQLMKDKFLSAFSVGFIPLEMDNSGQYTYAKQELLELSVVPVPANPDALAYLKEFAPEVAKTIEPREKKEEEPKLDTKAGRVLSAKNEDLLRQSVALLSQVLAALDENKGEEEPINIPASDNQESDKKKIQLLQSLRDHLRKSDKHQGLALKELKELHNYLYHGGEVKN